MSDFQNLSDIVLRARRRADMENSTFVTDAEIRDYINSSYKELFDILVTKNDDYNIKSDSISVISGTSSYDLPSDYYKTRGVDLVITSSDSVPLRRYNFSERTKSNESNYFTTEFKYKIEGTQIKLIPDPTTSHTITHWYVPVARKQITSTATGATQASAVVYTIPPLSFAVGDEVNAINFIPTDYNGQQTVTAVSTTTVTTDTDSSGFSAVTSFGNIESTIDAINGFDEYIVVDVAIKLLDKEESSTTRLERQKFILLERIEIMSQNRDAGEPLSVTDIDDYHTHTHVLI